MKYIDFNLPTVFWALVITVCFVIFMLWRRKCRERRFVPGMRFHPEARTFQKSTRAGFFVCPDCGLLAEQVGDCPECSDVKPLRMIPGDPDALELYLQRQTIFYGSPLE